MARTIPFPEEDQMPAYSESGIPNVRPMRRKSFDGSSVSCWQFSPVELQAVIASQGVFWVHTTIDKYQPIIRVTPDKTEGFQPMPKALKGG